MCYTVPLVASAVSTYAWSRKRDPKLWQLNLLFYGAAAFGVIDHLWNGELFLISDNVAKDLLLGVVITAAIFAGWIISVKAKKQRTVA